MDFKLILSIIGISITISSIFSTIIYNLILKRMIDESLEQFKSKLQNESYVRQKRWELKREACLKALDIANSLISHGRYPNVKEGVIITQDSSTKEIRECYDLISATCDGKEVLNVLKKIVGGSFSPDVIVDMRNAVRQELEFGNTQIDNDREFAFVGRTIFDGDPT